MSDDQDQSRTEEATTRRRERAREEGQLIFSPDLSAGAMLSMVALCCSLFWEPIISYLSNPFREIFTHLAAREWNESLTVLSCQWLIFRLSTVTVIMGLLTTGTTLLVTQFQSGFTFTTQPFSPKWEKLSPAAGWTRLFSLESLVRGGLALLKLGSSTILVLCLLAHAVKNFRIAESGLTTTAMPVEQSLLLQLLLGLSGITLLWGLVDYGVRWIRHEQKLKMSKQEVKDEHKEDQVDPLIRSKIRRAQHEAARRRSLQDVPQATLVITNPTHYAVALKYQSGGMSAPVVVAKGTDAFARRIAEAARKNGVPVFERKPLTRAIFALAEIGDEIPIDFYKAIAELLAQVYRLKGQVA